MNTLDLGAIPPLSLHGPVCWAQRPYFIKRAHLQVLHWERDTALVGRGEVMIGELGDDWERGEGGQDECKQKKCRAEEHRCKSLGGGTQAAKKGPAGRTNTGTRASQDLTQVIGRGQSRDCPQASHAGGGA